MYRAMAMSALGPDPIPDTVDSLAGRFARSHGRNNGEWVIHWRKQAGLLYAEQRTNGRWAVMRHGKQAVKQLYATLAGARGRIAWEAKKR